MGMDAYLSECRRLWDIPHGTMFWGTISTVPQAGRHPFIALRAPAWRRIQLQQLDASDLWTWTYDEIWGQGIHITSYAPIEWRDVEEMTARQSWKGLNAELLKTFLSETAGGCPGAQ